MSKTMHLHKKQIFKLVCIFFKKKRKKKGKEKYKYTSRCSHDPLSMLTQVDLSFLSLFRRSSRGSFTYSRSILLTVELGQTVSVLT